MRDIHYPLSKWGKSLQSINRDACAWSNFCAGKMQKIFLRPVAGIPLPFITIDFHKGVNLHSTPPPCFNLHAQKSVHAHASVVMVRRDSGGVGHPRNGERSAGASDCNAAPPRRCSSCKFARFPTSKSICTRAGIPVFGDEIVGNRRHTTITAVLPRR